MSNRIFKFRAWDGKNMIHEVTIYNGRFIDCSTADEDIFMKWHDPSEEIAIMQFTGLKDKNGVDIYEGDILSFPTSNWMNQVVEVVWYEKQHCWALKNKHGIQHTTSGGRSYLINGKSLEVIGNIYENPTLLK